MSAYNMYVDANNQSLGIRNNMNPTRKFFRRSSGSRRPSKPAARALRGFLSRTLAYFNNLYLDSLAVISPDKEDQALAEPKTSPYDEYNDPADDYLRNLDQLEFVLLLSEPDPYQPRTGDLATVQVLWDAEGATNISPAYEFPDSREYPDSFPRVTIRLLSEEPSEVGAACNEEFLRRQMPGVFLNQ